MRHTLICPQFGGQVDQLGGEIWEEAQHGQRSNAETNGETSNTRDARRRTSCVSGKNVIHQSVCCELSNILRGNVFVEGLQLGLALVELLVVALEISIRLFSKRARARVPSRSRNSSPSPGRCVRGTHTLPL